MTPMKASVNRIDEKTPTLESDPWWNSAWRASVRVVGVLILCLLFSAQLGAEDSRVPWLGSLDVATEQARAESKLILVDFRAEDCRPCTEMDRDVWTDVEVGLLAGDFVPLRLEVADDPLLARRFSVQGTPALVFLDGCGDLLHTDPDARTTAQVVSTLRAMRPDTFSQQTDPAAPCD